MTEGEQTKLIAWSTELRAVHQRMRQALRVTRTALDGGEPTDSKAGDLLLYCHGFCAALAGQHEGEDRELFPAIAADHPELWPTLRSLQQDHRVIAELLTGLRDAVDRAAAPAELDRHLQGIGAIMENHFGYEERQLLKVLDSLVLDTDPRDALGPL